MSDWLGGALVSEVLKGLIQEAKTMIDFKLLSEDLASTMERMIPLTEQIETIQGKADFDHGDLKVLKQTIQRARKVLDKCQRGGVWFYEKPLVSRKIKGINKDMVKFCQMDLQLHQYRNQLGLSVVVGNIDDKVEGWSKRMDSLSVAPVPAFTDHLCSVPKLDKPPVGLDWPLMDLKKRFIDNTTAASLVVSAPPGCGKTTLVTHLCNNVDVKRHFKHILFNVVSSTPNFRTIVQNLIQYNGHAPQTFENDTQATVALRKVLEKLTEDGGPILLVLDDVWQGADSFLEKFRISIRNYKVLVTSRSEFQSFGPTYCLKPLEYENARALLVQWASRPVPNNASPDEYDNLLKKLVRLKKLSLVMCSFGEDFYDIEDETVDVSRALPSLQEIDIDYCYDLDEVPYWVCEVVSLKSLSITNCNKLSLLPEAIGNLSRLQVLRLSSCINLSELPETMERLGQLQFLDISHCLGLRKLPLEIGKLQKLKKMSMRKCWRCELPDSVKNLEDLVVKCDEETGLVLWERLKPKMRSLRVHVEEIEHNLNLLHMF